MDINKIYDMDCLELLSSLDDNSVDMFFIDPPYGETHNNWDTLVPIKPFWEQISRTAKPDTPILIFGHGAFTAQMIMSNIEQYRYTIIWQKTTPTNYLNAHKMPLRVHEDIIVFYDKLPYYNPIKTTGHTRKTSFKDHKRDCVKTSNYNNHKLINYDSTERFPVDIWKFATDKQKLAIHPTQKPLELCKYAIRTYSEPDDLIVDCCCGSGTILQAAKLTGRQYIGSDNGICNNPTSDYYNQKWADVARYRLNNLDY